MTGEVNAKPELDPDIPTPLPHWLCAPGKVAGASFWTKPRLLPGEAAMTLTSIKQQLASTAVAKAMPTSAASRKNKGNTQERILQEETRLEFFPFCQKSCCVDTQALSRLQTATKKHSGKANCPSDNEEIRNYCLANRQEEDRGVTSVKDLRGIRVSKIRSLVVHDFHFISKYTDLPPHFAPDLLFTLIYEDTGISRLESGELLLLQDLTSHILYDLK